MEPKFTVFPGYVNGSNVEDEILYPNLTNGFDYHVPSPDLSFMDEPFVSLNPEPSNFTPSDDSEFSDPILKYINQILMKENVDIVSWEDQDPLALRNTEQSLYQVLQQEQSPPLVDQIVENRENESRSNSHFTPTSSGSSGTDSLLVSDVEDHNPSVLQVPLSSDDPHFPSSSDISFDSTPSEGGLIVQNMFNGVDFALQFKRGYDEANKLLPKIDLQKSNSAANRKVGISNGTRQQSPDGSRGRKHHGREDINLEEGRRTKQSAIDAEENELSDMFDKVLLYESKNDEEDAVQRGTLETNWRPNATKRGKTRSKRQEKKKDTVDLRTLLITCAQAVSSSDYRTATELLKQIRENASPDGDGSQRLAHYFANGLEARLQGVEAGTQNFFHTLASDKTSAADLLRSYRVSLTAVPKRKLAMAFANKTICKMAEKAKALHIVDFGILFGFQWPILIQLLSMRDGGPPKLRITGIELPQRGFRPAERIEKTGHRLASYCKRFNVAFEFNGIALQGWETLQLEDLKIDKNEMLVVNNLYRFENLLDDTEMECPRNAVLRIIRSMNPNLVVHSVVNGSFNTPFFGTRFREALYYYSSIFDSFDATVSRIEHGRQVTEKIFYGRAVMNVVACEGAERTVRPESYKRWHLRNLKAGFQPVPLDQELMQILRENLKLYYHKDFLIAEDGAWMLQGWKGRIIHASSCWIPS